MPSRTHAAGSLHRQSKVDSTDPGDWRWQLNNAVTSLDTLESVIELGEREREGVRNSVRGGLPLSITPYYLSLCDGRDAECPIRRQCVPLADEANEIPGDLRDPLGEEAHRVAPHLVQRYPDRALLLVTDRCAVYCRFCTRSRLVGGGRGASSIEQLRPAFDHLRRHPEIAEVIVSGGDPLLMSSDRLAAIIDDIAEIPSVLHIRVATRLLATLPQRVTPALCRALRRHRSTWLMSHFNHPRELTDRARSACAALVDSGIPIMNQTVLLRGINDDPGVLSRLFRKLVRERVRPYYLLQADPVRGTGHFRTPLSAGVEIMERLQGRLSGIALPRFIVDTPGGRGKVPVGPDYVVARGGNGSRRPGVTTLRTFRGERVDYIDPRDGS
jgi:lysine 2,3-aminomutase